MRKREYRVWDRVDRVMLSTRESWTKIWKGEDSDPENDYDFHSRDLFISQDGHILEHTDEYGICDTHWLLQGQPRYVLMDFIGRMDGTGEKVFEDDILQVSPQNPVLLRVIWDDSRAGYCLEDIDEAHQRSKLISAVSRFEVIGNVWQNPEFTVAIPLRI